MLTMSSVSTTIANLHHLEYGKSSGREFLDKSGSHNSFYFIFNSLWFWNILSQPWHLHPLLLLLSARGLKKLRHQHLPQLLQDLSQPHPYLPTIPVKPGISREIASTPAIPPSSGKIPQNLISFWNLDVTGIWVVRLHTWRCTLYWSGDLGRLGIPLVLYESYES